jgi:hypothetical protein
VDSPIERGAVLEGYYEALTDPRCTLGEIIIAAQRQALLTPLLSGLVSKTGSRFGLPKGVSGVILAMKAWVRYGIDEKLENAAFGIGTSAASAAAGMTVPLNSSAAAVMRHRQRQPLRPSRLWMIFNKQGRKRVDTQPPGLALEMVVLKTIEQQVHTGGDATLEPYRRPGSGEFILFTDCLKTMASRLRPEDACSVTWEWDLENCIYVYIHICI